MKQIIGRVSAIASLGLGWAALATAQISAYSLKPFTTDTAVLGESNVWRTYFELPRGFEFASDPSVLLNYELSPTLIPASGSITILVNGQPVDSRRLPDSKALSTSWKTSIPRRFLKAGINELQIASRKRSLTGDCVDEDNLSNWIRFLSSSTITLAKTPGPVTLRSYPFPFLNGLSSTVMTAPIVVPSSDSPVSLGGALTLVSDWGNRIPDRPVTIRMVKSSSPGSTVTVGLQKDLNLNTQMKPIEIRDGGLWVTGIDEKQLQNALNTLSDRELSSQLTGTSVDVSNFAPPKRNKSPRLGNVTFSDLGFQPLELRGVGTHSEILSLRRPLVTNLGRGGNLRLKFRHSAGLLTPRSVLTVSVNSEKVASIQLTSTNKDGGELVVPLPISQASKNEWNIQISADHDIGSNDCSRLYDNVAWTTILPNSEFELTEGMLVGLPYLEGFPYLRNKDGALPTATMNLGANPSESLLSLAGTLAARAGQTNRAPLTWQAKSAAVSGDESIVFAGLTDEDRLAPLAGSLLFTPSKSGTPVARSGLKVLPSILPKSVVLQAVANKSGSVTYVVMGDEDGYARLIRFMARPASRDLLSGQAAVLTEDGRLFTFDTEDPEKIQIAEREEMNRYKPEMNVIMGIVILLAIAGLLYLGSRFVKRKPKAT